MTDIVIDRLRDEVAHPGLAKLLHRFPGRSSELVRGLDIDDLVSLYWAYELVCSSVADMGTLRLRIEAEIWILIGRQMIGRP